jgi:hypothetical protein
MLEDIVALIADVRRVFPMADEPEARANRGKEER